MHSASLLPKQASAVCLPKPFICQRLVVQQIPITLSWTQPYRQCLPSPDRQKLPGDLLITGLIRTEGKSILAGSVQFGGTEQLLEAIS
jgi:hypothetical protein